MSWDAHVSKVCLSLSRYIGIISRNKHILPAKTKLNLYYAFFYSYVSYCFLVWGQTTSSNIQKLLVLQKRILRVIANVPYDAPTRPIYQQYRMVPVTRMFDYRFSSFYKKIIAGDDAFFSGIVTLTPHRTPYVTRQRMIYSLPRCRTNYGFSTLKYILPKYLNTPFYDTLHSMFVSAIRNVFSS
ncbi:uncharacterized protein LOC144103268 [Amblyomma americanum]